MSANRVAVDSPDVRPYPANDNITPVRINRRQSERSSARARRRHAPPALIIAAAVWLILLIAAALLASQVAPHDPTLPNLRLRNLPPAWHDEGTWSHPLGTDHLGYDIFSRILYGARTSLAIAAAGALAGTVIGVTLGGVAGYARGFVDWIIMTMVDAWLALPFLIIAILVIVTLGKGTQTLVLLVAISGWVLLARACRASVLSLRAREFVETARVLGASETRILARHIAPNLSSLVLVIVTLDIRGYIMLEASLSFLGLGVQPPNPSWGDMINVGRESLFTAWWISLMPATALLLTVVSISLIGEWLQETRNPR